MADDTVIIKSKGVENKLLTEEDLKVLLSGNNVKVNTNKIFTSLKSGGGCTGDIKNMNMLIKPELNNRISLNKDDVNLETKTTPCHWRCSTKLWSIINLPAPQLRTPHILGMGIIDQEYEISVK